MIVPVSGRHVRGIALAALITLGLPLRIALTQAPRQDAVATSQAATDAAKTDGIDLTRQPTLYLVPYTHLDTQWNWDYVATIGQYLPETMRKNFEYFEKYPHYIFNFTGANRYRLMKEYYPTDFATLRRWVAAGRWFPAGSSMEEGDVNSPNAESIFRQILYGNEWFRREFGMASEEYMLPDCFGFPSSLPSILAAAGIEGFSTQKLNAAWQPSPRVGGPGSVEQTPEGIPFNVGRWIGPDGHSVLAALNPGAYESVVNYDLTQPLPQPLATGKALSYSPFIDWTKRVDLNGRVSGLYADYHYIGRGDIGGAPAESSVQLMELLASKDTVTVPLTMSGVLARPGTPGATLTPLPLGEGPLHVLPSYADQMFRDIVRTGTMDRLPTYTGELELINHSAGSLTSQTMQKRWNRENEVLADAAERASVAAAWLGGRAYPKQRLTDAWTLVMGGQFHDAMGGTATPKAYEYSWNDDVIALNQFAGVVTSATAAVASVLDTRARGTPVVVYNALNIARQDVVSAVMPFQHGQPSAVRVVGPDGKTVPSQLAGDTVLFLAAAPSVGYAVYDVQPVTSPTPAMSGHDLLVTDSTLENARYRVTLNHAGDVASIFDKQLRKELLSAPLRLALQTEQPQHWPAWNMDWSDQRQPPRGYVDGPATVHITERGPVRVALSVTRHTDSSAFEQTIRLAAGDAGNRVEFGNVIDWRTGKTALKASVSTTAANPVATYNWDVGTIQRGNNNERQFEVGSHQWIDLTDTSRAFGVTVLTDAKNGSDKPDDNTLRLTLLYTPGTLHHLPGTPPSYFEQYSYMATNDWGHHVFSFGLAGHAGDYRSAGTDWQGYRLNQPLIAMATTSHAGTLGKTFSLLRTSSSRIRVLAVKQAEAGDEVIVRAVELDGRAEQGVRFTFAAPVVSVRDVDAQERPLHDVAHAATIVGGAVVADFGAYQPRTFAVRLAAPAVRAPAPLSYPLALAYDRLVSSYDGARSSEGFDGKGNALPAELLPSTLDFAGVRFHLGSHAADGADAVIAHGQTLTLPAQHITRVYVLAAAADSDHRVTFRVGNTSVTRTVQRWTGYVGSWDNRQWKTLSTEIPARTLPPEIDAGSPEAAAFERDHKGKARTWDQPFGQMVGITPGFIKRADIAWYASHHHAADGSNQIYSYSYLFAYPIDVPAGARTLTLPNDPAVRIMAITAVDASASVRPVQALYDTLGSVSGNSP